MAIPKDTQNIPRGISLGYVSRDGRYRAGFSISDRILFSTVLIVVLESPTLAYFPRMFSYSACTIASQIYHLSWSGCTATSAKAPAPTGSRDELPGSETK